MRIVFVGAVEFSRQCLQEIVANHGHVVGVLTLEPAAAGGHADYADLAPAAAEGGIPLYRIREINDPDTIELIRSLRPDVIFVFGWSQILSKAVREIPPRGCIGSHPALLPRHRGRHPIVWALAEGLTESGLTFFYLDQDVDSGDIVWQRAFPIALEDDASSVYARITALAKEAIREFLVPLAQGRAPRRPQASQQATYWRKRSERDGEIQWQLPSPRLYNLIRALTHPYVGAHTFVEDEKVIVWRSAPPDGSLSASARDAAPGTVLKTQAGALWVRTGDGYLRILEYERSSGAQIPVGTHFGRRVSSPLEITR